MHKTRQFDTGDTCLAAGSCCRWCDAVRRHVNTLAAALGCIRLYKQVHTAPSPLHWNSIAPSRLSKVAFAALLTGAMLIILLGADEVLLFKLLSASSAEASCASSKLMPAMPASRLLRIDCAGGMALALGVVLVHRGRLEDNWVLERIMMGALPLETAPVTVPGWIGSLSQLSWSSRARSTEIFGQMLVYKTTYLNEAVFTPVG